MRENAERSPGPLAGHPGGEEAHAMRQVVATLRRAFPDLPEREVADCVARIHASFALARVRTYVPVLVEREAYDALAAGPASPGQEPMAPSIASASGPEDAGF